MLRNLCMILLCFTIVGCKAEKEKIEWEKHDFSIYSLELPASWPIEPPYVSMSGDTLDHSRPNFNEDERLRRWGFSRKSILLTRENFEEALANMMSIYIESLESKSEKPFTIEEEAKKTEEFYAGTINSTTTTLKRVSSTADEIRYTYIQEGKTIPTGTLIRMEGFMIFKQDGEIVHRIRVSAGSECLKKNPEAKAIMERIVRSFTPRQKPDSLINH